MKLGLLLISLTVTLVFNQTCVSAAEYPEELLYPFLEIGERKILVNPYLDQSFLDYLESNGVYPVIGKDGSTLFYFSENEEFGCLGVCDQIVLGDYIMGSQTMEPEAFAELPKLENQVVIGNEELERHIDSVNALREILSDDPVALDEVEKALLESNQDPLKRVYYENAYEDVFDYAIEDLKGDPDAYNSIVRNLEIGNLEGGVNAFESFISENYDLDESFDVSDLYSALEDRKIGPKQFEELLENVLDRIAENEGIDIDLEGLDRFSELLGTEEFDSIMDKVTEAIENNPETFDMIKELSEDILKSPESKEMFQEAVKKMMENVNWESIQRVMDLFNKMDNKEKLLETLIEGVGEYMRELAESGKADEIKSLMTDENLIKLMDKAFQSFSESFLDVLRNWVEDIPIEFAYILALAVTITTLIMLARIKM